MNDLPKTSAPTERALLSIKVTKLAQLTKYTEKQIADLHGVGPKSIRIFNQALKEKGLSFKK